MRRGLIVTKGAALLLALALTGCGGSGAPTTVPRIAFKSPAILSGSIPAQYTCAGANHTPPLEWGTVPAGTAEVAVFVLGFTPISPSSKNYRASVEWAVAGVNPALHKLTPGVLPAGAHLGRDSDGKKRYSICPKKGTTEQYQFELYAVSPEETIKPSFNGLPVVAALANSKPGVPTMAHGGFNASFSRM
jgi:phosphatidylethanolamine-binding protein (PEBP) family uncharacterized protein